MSTHQDQSSSNGAHILDILRTKGITDIDCPFDKDTLDRWNKVLDPLFKKESEKANGPRSYILIQDLLDAGIFEEFWNAPMRSFVRSIIPDAVIESFEFSETITLQKEADLYGINNEWHRDIQQLPGLSADEPLYVSIFIYLSEVGPESGGFEIRPVPPSIPFSHGDQIINMQGPIGTTFVWNRGFYHRASMNRSALKRRIFKVSLQHNYLESAMVASDLHKTLREKFSSEDPYLYFLLGGKHHSTHDGYLLPDTEGSALGIHAGRNVNTQANTSRLWRFYRRGRFFVKRMIKKIAKK
jgi:hypothetical protein